MKTNLFIKLTSSLALIVFALLAFSSCQQAGRNYQRQGYSNQSYQGSRSIKTNPGRNYSSSRSGSNCAGGS